MIQNATGLILRTRPLTETSLIVHWLTPDFGRIATAAKGARRAQSPFLGKLDLFYLADFSFSRSRRSDLHTLREVSLRETHGALRQDLGRLRQAAYAASFVEQATETETPLPAVFELMREFLVCLCRQKSAPQNVFAFESQAPARTRLETGFGGNQTDARRKTNRPRTDANQLAGGFAYKARPRANRRTAPVSSWFFDFSSWPAAPGPRSGAGK